MNPATEQLAGYATQIPSALWAIAKITPRSYRSKVLWSYLKIVLKFAAFTVRPPAWPYLEKVVGLPLWVLDYYSFVAVFTEVFVRRDYHFQSISESPVIIDCGSNIGVSVAFFKRLYPKCRIIAFEPDALTFQVLKKNAETNGWSDTTLYNCAVSSVDGTVDFYSDPSRPGSLVMSAFKERFPGPKRHTAAKNRVKAVRLSRFIESQVDFLKIDIEGAELGVIEELARENKLTMVRELVVEYHHHLRPGANCLSTLFQVLERSDFGYQLFAPVRRPFLKGEFQDMLIYAYHL